MAVIVVVAGSIAAQTHVPYLLNAIAICALVLGTMVWRLRDREQDAATVEVDVDDLNDDVLCRSRPGL